ncbi:5'-nucleotidase C-terminal domain-containing protein [Bacillus vallismortis]|uniref:5'-nucleotidase C-terminal domain-containing protein n=1 Tax=Bacillus vallismortis TaxID=72361 RepID=A0ABY4Y1S4_BACVA|nr:MULTISPECIES: 5'-nucleotidase C-terminal domain-containing protein [Bacillus]MBL3649148.1 5'-nucleotidase C-terminal domain-containing protein [Bacillus sp. RHFS10]USP96413.1 5'-nucleotidase C-terminal domain-containing protein [Bacillus vallismortis]
MVPVEMISCNVFIKGGKMMRRILHIVLVAALMFLNVMYTCEAVKAAEPQHPISVDMAVQQKEGQALVEGYAVGQAVSPQRYKLTSPFSNDYHVALADSKNEASPEHILPVQIPSDFRSRFGLQTNPLLLGKKITVQGQLEEYFNTTGLKNVQSMNLTDDMKTPPAEQLVTINEARGRLNKEVTIKGIVTADQSAVGGGKLSTFVQDETGGINIYSSSPELFPELKEGMDITVKGKITTYQGLTEIVPNSSGIKINQSNQSLPAPIHSTINELVNSSLGDQFEGRLVTLKAFVSSIPNSPAGGGYNVTMIDGDHHAMMLRVMNETGAIGELDEGKWYEFTGVLSRYQSLQLLPRKSSDLKLLEEQPAPPSAEGEYEGIVDRVVDGDTIHLKSPILGTTKVRFVNVDTPETYHTPKNEADENQLSFGKKASDYLKTILSSGERITVKVGSEAKDSYGRLLGQVITESGSNVNLELVKNGYAPTYFIWPVDNEEDYQQFQAAAAAAKKAQKGIWNENDPLMEMPFEFRAREQGKGLTRYVGDSSNKTYVEPAEWKQVAVENRIFFASASEAENAGYKKRQTAPEQHVPLSILSMNDLHGKIDQQYELDLDGNGTADGVFGRMDYAAAYLKEKKAEKKNTLIVHAGDMIGGSSPVSSLLQDEPTVELMEDIGFDVGTVGNHEFDEGADELLRILNGGDHPKGTSGYDGQNFPLVCANCKMKSTGEPFLPAYDIINVESIPVAFIGVVTQSAAGMVMPEGIKNIEFTDEVTAVNEAAEELKKKGVKAIAVLAHMSAEQNGTAITGESADLANKTDAEIDVIFAAHNHKIVNGEVNGKLIVQAFEYGKAIGVVDVEIDKTTKDIVKKSAEIEYVDQSKIEPDPSASAILNKYQTLAEPIISEVVGEAAIDMEGGYSNDGDTPLGNLIADGMRAAMKTDFALMNGGGIREALKKGPITWGDLYNIQPFGNVLTKLEIKGKDLRKIINAQISPVFGPDYSISGFTYTWDKETGKAVEMKMADGAEIQPDATYTLTVNNFMATATGTKYQPIGSLGKNPVTGPEDLDATVEYVKSFDKPIAYTKEGRIKLAEASDIEDPVTEDPGNGPGTNQPVKDVPEPGEDHTDIKETPGTVPFHQLPPSASLRIDEIPKKTADTAGGISTLPVPNGIAESGSDHQLPDTSAGYYNFIVIGAAAALSGTYLYVRRKRSASRT